MKKSVLSGFTLTEVMITVSIIAVLAGLAIPGFFRTVERSRANEAISNLNIIYMGQKIYRINNGSYWNGGNNLTANAVNTALSIDISTINYNITSVTAIAGTSFTARLTRNNVSGGAGTKWYQYNYTFGNAAPVQTEGGAF